MSDFFDNSHLAEIGEEYERFVGAYFEIVEKCHVFYNGKALGVKDGGIDLVAVNMDFVYLIQCKNYSSHNIVRENTIHQIAGAAKTFIARFPIAHNVTPLVATTSSFSDDAVFAAKANGVILRHISYNKKWVENRNILFNDEISTESHKSITYGICKAENQQSIITAMIQLMQLEKLSCEIKNDSSSKAPVVQNVSPETTNPWVEDEFADEMPNTPPEAPKASVSDDLSHLSTSAKSSVEYCAEPKSDEREDILSEYSELTVAKKILYTLLELIEGFSVIAYYLPVLISLLLCWILETTSVASVSSFTNEHPFLLIPIAILLVVCGVNLAQHWETWIGKLQKRILLKKAT